MVVEGKRLPVETLTRVAHGLASGLELRPALELIAAAAAEATAAQVAVVRVLDPATGMLVARAIAPPDSALAAELAGSRVPADATGPIDGVRFPARAGDGIVGAVELLRGGDLDESQCALAELAAAQLALVVQTLGASAAPSGSDDRTLAATGEALATGADLRRVARQTLRVAVEATGAAGGVVWSRTEEGGLEPVALGGGALADTLDRASELALDVFDGLQRLVVEPAEELPAEARYAASIQLGQPPFGVLQLFYGEPPEERRLAALPGFAAHAAHALRAADRADELERELERTRAVVEIVGEANAQLSLAYRLETAVDRTAELLRIARVGVYLRENGSLLPAAGRALPEGHEAIVERLQELALGPFRARSVIDARAGDREPALAPVRAALRAAGVDSALAVPLRVAGEPIGLLVAYPGSRAVSAGDSALITSLAAQLAVAVQNARLHEHATELGDALGTALDAERDAARRLGALYEISRSFAQSLSLDATLEAVASTIVGVLDVDAAVIRVPTERGDALVPHAVHVAETRLADAVRTILERPQPSVPRRARPVVLDPATAARLGGAHALLVPFLEQGSTAATLPIASPAELLAELTILSLDPARPISEETLATATTIAAQAALAIDNARLYQQQKQFADTIQRALLPRERPQVRGLELGAVYESAARVEVGGDVWDFLELADGRLAVVLGDVTGHGIDATADMALAKFVFRSLVREHSEPHDFLAHANEVVAGEIALGKFVTMVYLAIDPRGEVACASAGHPAPRLILPGGVVRPLAARGLALGIEPLQEYEAVRAELPVGAAVVLYTDGVIESRAGREPYGVERLDAALATRHELPAEELAQAVLEDCRAYGGGDLADDCAIVVVRRTA
jgi:serine phosphatase RsbU (regulator of sigma subunit)